MATLDVDPVPLIFRGGDDLALYRNEYDLGWWKFYFVEALPETKVIIVPLQRSDAVSNTMRDIVLSSPSTENVEAKTYFGFGCNGTAVYFADWERSEFVNSIIPAYESYEDYVMNDCSLDSMPTQFRDAVLVTVSETYQQVDGILVMPVSDGIGYVYLNTSQPSDFQVYKSRMDLASLIFGGRKTFEHMNGKFAKELDTAADLKIREIGIISTRMQSRCITAYGALEKSLQELKVMDKSQISDRMSMESLSEKMKETKEEFDLIQSIGCD